MAAKWALVEVQQLILRCLFEDPCTVARRETRICSSWKEGTQGHACSDLYAPITLTCSTWQGAVEHFLGLVL